MPPGSTLPHRRLERVQPFKCKMFANARAPVDVVGTGSFIPEAFGDTFATADIFMYDGEFLIKVGREKLFQGLKP